MDEDYLVGISNKGIVKRAYKDLEAVDSEARAAAAALDWSARELTVAAGGETVTIRFPLGESQCSCPSRSICRHVVMAILLARQAAADGKDGTENGGSEGRNTGEAESKAPDAPSAGEAEGGDSSELCAEKSVAAGSDSNHMAPPGSGSDDSRDMGKTKGSVPGQGKPDGNSSGNLGQLVWQEILAQPRKPLLKALGSKGLRRLAAAMEAGTAPQVERGTVVRMQLPGQDMTVKLLSPLEYSTCTCHKKELCSHKAEAILWCQYLEKQLTVRELTGELEQEPAF